VKAGILATARAMIDIWPRKKKMSSDQEQLKLPWFYQVLHNFYIFLLGLIAAVFYPYISRFYAFSPASLYSSSKIKQSNQRPKIWIHGASAGEIGAALSLCSCLRERYPHSYIVCSAANPDGKRMAQEILAPLVNEFISYPLDLSWVVSRFLDFIQPDIFITMEAELWPNFLFSAKRKGIKCYLVSGRVSQQTFYWTQKIKNYWRNVLLSFDTLFMADQLSYERVLKFGLPEDKVLLLGNIKTDALYERKKKSQPERLAQNLGLAADLPVIVAGSIHKEEEELILEAFDKVRKMVPQVKIIIAPRHLDCCSQLVQLFKEKNFAVTSLSKLPADEEWEVLIIDQMGVLFDFYGLAQVAFVGGSLCKNMRGHNILEPAIWEIPVCYGPYVASFQEVASVLKSKGLSRVVHNSEELAYAWYQGITDTEWRKNAQMEAHHYFAQAGRITEKVVDIITKDWEQSRNA